MTTETIIVERHGRVGIVRLNRPQALNALNATLRNELLGAVEAFDADAEVGCILITGSDKAFAAGADIKEMADKSYIDIFRADYAPTTSGSRACANRSSRRLRDLRSAAAANLP